MIKKRVVEECTSIRAIKQVAKFLEVTEEENFSSARMQHEFDVFRKIAIKFAEFFDDIKKIKDEFMKRQGQEILAMIETRMVQLITTRDSGWSLAKHVSVEESGLKNTKIR